MRAILTYHSIDASASAISISKEAFERHVAWLASGRVRVVSVDELMQLPDSTDAVAITFDDGFQSFGEIAAPLLARHGLPSTLFIVSDHAGGGGTNAWGRAPDAGIPTLPLLGWRELERLAGRGVTLGAHTRTHRRLTALTAAELADEICGGARIIEQHTGHAPVGFAYPYGSVSNEAAAVVRGAFAWGCTTELRALRKAEDRARLPRLDMFYFRERGRLESWGTTRFDYYLKLRSHARRIRQRWAAASDSP